MAYLFMPISKFPYEVAKRFHQTYTILKGKFFLFKNIFSPYLSFSLQPVLIIIAGTLCLFISSGIFFYYQSQKNINYAFGLIEEQLSEKLNLYEKALTVFTHKLQTLDTFDENTLRLFFKQYHGHKIYLTPSHSINLGSLAIAELINNKTAICIAGSSLLQPQWTESFIKTLSENPKIIQVSEPFQLGEDEKERFINITLPFPYQGKLLFINLVISVEEFLEDIKKIVEHTSLNAEIRGNKNQEIALFSSASKEWTPLEKSTFKSLNRVPYKIYLYRSGMTFFEWGYVLCLSVSFILLSVLLYRCLQKNTLSLKTNLEGQTLAKLKSHHKAFKDAVYDAENERNKLVTTYFQIVSNLIQKTKTDIINFERSQRSPALSYRVVENLWNLLKQIEKGEVLFSYPSTSFTVLDTLQSCLSFHKIFLHQNNIQTNIEECVEDKELIGNEFLVKILFIRLLDYCLQDVPQGGVLTIKLKPAQDYSIALSMKSNGFGLNDKDLSCVTFHQQEPKGDPFLCHFYSLETLANCLGAEMSSSATLYQGREIQLLLPRQLDLKNPSESSFPKGVKGEVISLFDKQ